MHSFIVMIYQVLIVKNIESNFVTILIPPYTLRTINIQWFKKKIIQNL